MIFPDTMILVNKEHPAIKEAHQKNGNGKAFVTISDPDIVYFTEALRRQLKLTPGKYLHFYNAGKRWYFFQNDDPVGFKLTTSRKGIRVRSAPLVAMIRSTMRFRRKVSLFVMKTGSMRHDSEIFEILTQMPYRKDIAIKSLIKAA